MAIEPHNDKPSAADVMGIAARAHERDRYLAALLAPRDVRDDLIALAAFAGEIGRIPAFVNEPMMGRVRMQWWRERIEDGSSGGHPIAAAVIATVNRYRLPKATLINLIDAHEKTLDDVPFADDATFEGYLQATHGTLFEFDQLVRGLPPAPRLIAAAAAAYGIARHLIELPATLAQGRVLLPVNRLQLAGMSVEELREGIINRCSIAPILNGLAADARGQLAVVRAGQRHLDRKQRRSFLPVALVEPYLRLLERHGLRNREAVDLGPLTRIVRLWSAHWTGRL